MTLVLVVRCIEGIAVVTDTVTTANTKLELYGEETDVEYHLYKRRKLSQINNFAIVHAGLSFINNKTVNQIVDVLDPKIGTVASCIKVVKETLIKEMEQDKIIPELPPERLILSVGIIGYKKDKPFVYRIIFFKAKEGSEELLDIVESEDSFQDPYYGIDYFGDFEFIQLLIRAAKEQNLLKPFNILTINGALDLARILMRFLIDFQSFMVSKTVAFPLESVIITQEEGLVWVDKMEYKKFHYDTHEWRHDD